MHAEVHYYKGLIKTVLRHRYRTFQGPPIITISKLKAQNLLDLASPLLVF